MDQLVHRNFVTINEAIKNDRERLDALEDENRKLKTQNAEIKILMQRLEQRLSILFAKSIGTGATSI